MLNNAAIQVSWDDMNRKETECAKKQFIQAKKEFRLIVNEEDQPIKNFREVANTGFFRIKEILLKPGQFVTRILNEQGDETIVWDSNCPEEIKEAADKFDEYIKNGWKAFAIDNEGDKHRRIRSFDADLEEIVFEEGVTMKVKEFVKKHKKVEVTPKTRPG